MSRPVEAKSLYRPSTMVKLVVCLLSGGVICFHSSTHAWWGYSCQHYAWVQ